MKKQVFIVVGIIFIISVLFVITNKTSNKTFMQDGVMFAVRVDGVKQNSFPSGNNYFVDIDCTNARGRWMRMPSTDGGIDDAYRIVIDEVTDNTTCDVDFITINLSNQSDTHFLNNIVRSNAVDETSETVTNSTSVTLTVGYRYKGTNPNNYIWFNNEMWRIIGVVPVCTSANCATKEDLVKIIRKDSIGSIAYDAKSLGYTGAWGSNTLYTLLNTKYWGKQDATNTATCYGYGATSKTKCDYTVIGLSSSDYYGNMVKQNVYWNTGASTDAADAKTVYGNESQTQQVQGNIGLMNASDYGYAGYTSGFGIGAAITLENWLYTINSQLTITQHTTASYVLDVGYGGSVAYTSGYIGYAVRPVLYLKDSVYVVNGDGSEATPYQIAMTS